MIFNQSYYSAMDRGYYIPLKPEEQPPGEQQVSGDMIAPDIGLSPKNIGISAPPFSGQLEGLKAKIFQGASKVELGFMGRGKGSMQGGNTTPEMFGKDERIDIRELAKVNKIQLTTHASPNAGSLAGFQQNKFDEALREGTLHEIQRAIDFAADTTNGGAVVVHAQEYPRPVRDQYLEQGFQAFPEEETRAIRHLVDQRSGQVQEVRKNSPLFEPDYEEYDKNNWKDIEGKPIPKTTDNPEELFRRVPIWNQDKTEFKTVKREWKDFEKMADNWNKANPKAERKKEPEEMWIRIQLENQILRSKGGSLFHGRYYQESKEAYNALKEALKFYEKIEEEMPKEEQWRLMERQSFGRTFATQNFIPNKSKLPSDWIKEQIQLQEMDLKFTHESSASSDADAARIQDDLKNFVPIAKYANDKTNDTIARSAMHALDREKKPSKEGLWGWDVRGGEKFERPLFIAIENFFPDVHGGHPDEVKKMVMDSRDKFADMLQNERGMNREAADKEAAARIKATWDTSHANMWRKYFQPAYKGEPMEKMDERFKKWYLDKAKEWRDENIMGHIHVSDNFGWEDEHVTPGQGNAPIKEFINLMKDKAEKGEIDVIVEPAHQDYKAMLGGWKLFGSSIYGLEGGRRDSWLDVERSYFGRNAPPYFLYGEAAPDPEAWQLWTGTKLE